MSSFQPILSNYKVLDIHPNIAFMQRMHECTVDTPEHPTRARISQTVTLEVVLTLTTISYLAI